MSLFTLQPSQGALLEVLSGSLTLPPWGAWLAHLELGVEVPVASQVVIQVAREDGAAPTLFAGTVIDGGGYEGRAPAVVMGGAGGLLALTTADHERAAPTAVSGYQLLSGLISDAGEVESPDLASQLTGLEVARWARAADETWARAIGRAAERLGVSWRVLDTGEVWAGVDAFQDADLDGRELDVDTVDRRVEVSFTAATARPGTTVAGRRITRVTFDTEGRAALLFEP